MHATTDLHLLDAFRLRQKDAREFTYYPDGNQARRSARRRLDRTYVSSAITDPRSAPSLRNVWHIHPADPLLHPADPHGGRLRPTPSDHAACACVIALSRHPLPPRRWAFNIAHLQDSEMLAALRDIITAESDSADEPRDASGELAQIRERVRNHVTAHENATRRDRTRRKKELSRAIALYREDACRGNLGDAETARTRAFLAARYERRLEDMLEQDARDWLRQRGIEAHLEDRPTKDFYSRPTARNRRISWVNITTTG